MHMLTPMKNERGFTLVELVISVALLAVIFSILYSALSQIIESKRLLDDRRDSTAIAAAIVGRMTKEFQLAYGGTKLLPLPSDAQKIFPPRVSLQGLSEGDEQLSRASITFLALEGGQYLPDGGTHSGLVQITYRVEKDPEAREKGIFYLIRDEFPYTRPTEKAHKSLMTFPITNRLVSFKIRYFSEEDDAWFDGWGEDNHLGLPQLIKFEVTIRSPLGREDTFTTTVALRSKT